MKFHWFQKLSSHSSPFTALFLFVLDRQERVARCLARVAKTRGTWMWPTFPKDESTESTNMIYFFGHLWLLLVVEVKAFQWNVRPRWGRNFWKSVRCCVQLVFSMFVFSPIDGLSWVLTYVITYYDNTWWFRYRSSMTITVYKIVDHLWTSGFWPLRIFLNFLPKFWMR